MALRVHSSIQRFWLLELLLVRLFCAVAARNIVGEYYKVSSMIIITVRNERREKNPFGERFRSQVMDMEKRVYETLFEGLECDHEDHHGFDNIIEANFMEQPPFRIEKICCEDFERKIRKAVM